MSEKKQSQSFSEDLKVTAADATLTASGKYDVKIFFGLTYPDEKEIVDGSTSTKIVYHSGVSLSPQLAKSLSITLSRVVSDYESNEMPLPLKAKP